jgi:uncharacterized protein YjdB
MTRAQFIAILTRFLFPKELQLMDPGEQWYSNNYYLAIKHGLLSSDEFNNGLLTVPCTRQDMAMLLVRVAYIANGEVATNLVPTARIADYESISEEYKSYVQQSFSLGLIAGVDSKGTFNPQGDLTRAQAATVIYRLIDISTRPFSPTSNTITFTWDNGITYTGEYSNGEANGIGTMVFPNIGVYTGYFNDGKREGLGTFRWDVGDSYIGIWNNDKMCGSGTYTFADGYTIRGIWDENSISAETLYMDPSSLTMLTDTVQGIVAKVTPEKITEKITWTSSNTRVVSVVGEGNLGKLTAKAEGTSTITAVTESGKKTSCVVTVKKPIVQKITLAYGDYEMWLGESFKLSVTLFPDNANDNIEWSSSDNEVVSVSQDGMVVAEGLGTAIISARTENGLIATCYVFVAG